ncbi:MAG: hypothetical protein M1833_007166 [Piccolia ochrophora]|nr:MAG: hypothetical protein M1833_007166 [Piccolia ochrophora]
MATVLKLILIATLLSVSFAGKGRPPISMKNPVPVFCYNNDAANLDGLPWIRVAYGVQREQYQSKYSICAQVSYNSPNAGCHCQWGLIHCDGISFKYSPIFSARLNRLCVNDCECLYPGMASRVANSKDPLLKAARDPVVAGSLAWNQYNNHGLDRGDDDGASVLADEAPFKASQSRPGYRRPS